MNSQPCKQRFDEIFLSSKSSPGLGAERAEAGVGTLLFSSRVDWVICR